MALFPFHCPFPARRCGGRPPAVPRMMVGALLVTSAAIVAACGGTTTAPDRSPDTTGAPASPATTGPATTPTARTATTATAAPPSAPTGSLSLFTEPDDDYHSVDQLIAAADRSIDLTMYELADTDIENLLADARRRGVSVRVLLDHAYSGASVNRAAYAQLVADGVPVRWATDAVIFHQKTLTVDGTVSAVMTGNLTSVYYPSTRDFTLIDRDPAAVAAIESVFASDWNGTPVTGGPAVAGLVWSPGSESALVDLIDSAHSSIAVENEEMDSGVIETALEAAARRGVNVQVTVTADPEWSTALGELAATGVRVATYPDTAGALYIHAKAVVVDGRTAFVGSQNFSTSSLDDNRELGVITTDPAVVGPVSTALADDFAGAVPVG